MNQQEENIEKEHEQQNEDKLRLKQFWEKNFEFTQPPISNGQLPEIYSQRLQEDFLPNLKFCQNFDGQVKVHKEKIQINQSNKQKDLKMQLKMAAYKIFSQMLRTFKTFSGEDKSHAQPRRVVDKIHKFYEICEEIRKVQQRQVICALLQRQKDEMKEEANEINNTLNEMHGEAKQYVLEESVENENNQIDVQQFMDNSMS